MPKTMTGQLHNLNKGAFDWGWQGLLAYGCQSCVVVVDPVTVQLVQILDHQRGQVVKVKWARENYCHNLSSPYGLRLASADTNGRILIWDVTHALVGAECVETGKPVADMDWVSIQAASHDLLAALHPPSTLVLWNTENGSRLWKKTYSDMLLSFAFDPFDPSRLSFLGQDCIVFVDDFSLSGAPPSSGKKFHISSPGASSVSHSTSGERLSDRRQASMPRSTIRRVSSILVGGDGPWKGGDDDSAGGSSAVRDCLQLVYHRACRQHLILVYQREILVIDLDIGQTVCVVLTERSGSLFSHVVPLRECDALFCVHESGGMSLRVRRRADMARTVGTPSLASEPDDAGIDVVYENRCHSESLRITKHNRVFGTTVCPVTERRAALLTSDGRILFWEVNLTNGLMQKLQTFPSCLPKSMQSSSNHGLNLDTVNQSPLLTLTDLVSMLDDNRQTNAERPGPVMRLMLTGLLTGLLPAPAILRMCPPLTTKNFSVYRPLLAIGGTGGSAGVIQLYDLSSGQLWREFSVHTCSVRGIEWVSRRGFLSFAYPTTTGIGNGLVRNEIVLTDIDTGRSVPLRTNMDDESPVEALRASYLKQYFVVLFRDRPFELWDLRTLSLLRRMPKNFPHVTALEWSPSHGSGSKAKKKASTPETNGDDSTSVTKSSSMLDLATTPSSCPTPSSEFGEERSASTPTITSVREHFVFTDINGLLYHFIVEGNLVRDGSKIPPDGGMGSITSIAWKAETLILSDVDGNLNIWDLRAKMSRAINTSRGWIRKIRFAPGRGNMKLAVLYNDGGGVDIWDAKDVERVASVRCPKDLAKVVDVEWAASDRPVLACADGCVRVMDIACSICYSPMDDYQLPEPIFCPHALAAHSGMVLRCLLQHQPWRERYRLDCRLDDGGAPSDEPVAASTAFAGQMDLLGDDLRVYLESCPFGTAERCLVTARLFGDESELAFWTVALHYIRAARSGTAIPRSASAVTAPAKSNSDHGLFLPIVATPVRESFDLLVFDESDGSSDPEEAAAWRALADRPLGACHDVVQDNRTFADYERRRAALHDARRAPGEPTRRCADDLILLGDADRAVQLLLETDPDDSGDRFYIDSLRACLVASIRSSGASQSTIKLVATNLIASGRLSEGVQLLCLIEKGADACRYLQTYGRWRDAARLAKTTLPEIECVDVMRRWAEHLASPAVDRHDAAAIVLLSLGRFAAVVDLLLGVRHFTRAALFVEACREFGLTVHCEAVQSVFAGYARYLHSLGLTASAEYYDSKAEGEKDERGSTQK